MTIKDELLAIQARDRKKILRVPAVHAWAKTNTKSALHKAITWDLQKAAMEFQFQQIRNLITLHIVSEDGTPEIVSLSVDRLRKGGGYRSVADVVSNKALSEVMLQDALDELQRMQIKYQRVTQLVGVWEETQKVRNRASRKAAKPARRVARGRGAQAEALAHA